jgi:serine/threonine protein kinase
MKKAGHPTVIPALYDVMATSSERKPEKPSDIKSIKIQMEYIAGETLHDLFSRKFPEATDSIQVRRNDALLIDILIQICVYLDILQVALRFNHRDLKINNVLRRRQDPGWRRLVHHESLTEPWTATLDLVIIDFGFSCIACGEEDPSSLIQAGSWFRPYHDCMKMGRDLALFLYCLHVYFPLHRRVSTELWAALKKATNATWSKEVVSLLEVGVDHQGMPGHMPTKNLKFDAGIYRFLRHSSVDVPGCSPRTLMSTLERLSKPVSKKVE